MPTSHPRTLSQVHTIIESLRPASVIDLGVGHGKTGVLMREYLEMWENLAYHREDWKAKVYGIEVFPDYRNPLWDYAYDEVLIGDAKETIDRLPEVDLIVALDVWEHFERPYGLALLDKCLAKAKVVLISTPIDPLPQDETYNNPHERHVSRWTPADFAHVPHRAIASNGDDWCFVLSSRGPLPRSLAEVTSVRCALKQFWRVARQLWKSRRWQAIGRNG